VREADGGYVLRTQCLAEQVVLPRRERQQALASYAQQFVQWLESVLVRAPMAWFNFFPFWQQAAQRPGHEQHDGTSH
jgi:predicted LPLAT superfamily acyltransferase